MRKLHMFAAAGLLAAACTVAALLMVSAASSAYVAPPTTWAAVDPSGVFRPDHDVTVSGLLSVSAWEIPENVTVSVSRDLIVECSGDIVIRGRLVAAPAGEAIGSDGVNITLRTPGTITLSGVIQAGDGAPAMRLPGGSGDVALAGGRGGDVLVDASVINGAGQIRAGDGGDGMLGGLGGDGGRAVLLGAAISPEKDLLLLVRGGSGGRGGDGVPGLNAGIGGDGGDGGDAFVVPDTNGGPGAIGRDSILTGCAGNGLGCDCVGGFCHPAGFWGANAVGGDGGPGGGGTSCGNGGSGGRGGNAQSKCGGNGAVGPDCATGGNGGGGGNGGSATGGRGGDGGNGAECCCGVNGPGGRGGAGGQGGSATSGSGGSGGHGGNSTHNPLWTGGNGGNGGNGGLATGGLGGNGGDGAKGTPVGSGGVRGNGGSATAGIGGSGGTGGIGNPAGTPGTAGVAGTATQGVVGTSGVPGRTTCAIHAAVLSENTNASAPPPASPGLAVALTSIDEQSLQSSGYHIGRNSETQCVHFCWTGSSSIPASVDDWNWNAMYGSYDGSSVKATSMNLAWWSYARRPNLAVDGQDLAHVAFHQRADPGLPYRPWVAYFPSYCNLLHTDDEMSGLAPCPEYIEPRIAISQRPGGADVIHIIANASSDCPPGNLIYLRYAGGIWSGPVAIDVTPGYGYAIAADPNSDKVAIVLHTNAEFSEGMLNIAYYESQTAGVGWLSGTELGPTNKNIITNYNNSQTGVEAGFHITAAYDNASDLHAIWDERQPAAGNTAAILRHWNRQANAIHQVAAGLWQSTGATGTYDLNLAKMTLGIGDGCTKCLGGLVTNRDYLYVVYTQFGGPTPTEQADRSALGYMNGELYLTVSVDHGATWSSPQNLTNTKTPGCNPGPTPPGGTQPPRPDSVCRSEHWASIGQTVNDIDILCISDQDAGAVTRGMGTWQLNPVMYLRLTGGTTDARYLCPCSCPCQGDLNCDGMYNMQDVVLSVDVAFRGAASVRDPLCPRNRIDVDCDGSSTVMDVVRIVSVVFRGGNPATQFCNPCAL